MVHLMEKLDAMTPWHILRVYETAQEAKTWAYKYAAMRAPGATYPKYNVNGMDY